MTKDLSKISKNNKARGRNFENKVASTLGWTRVPYSGAHKVFGSGDVVDGYQGRNGLWCAECKTQQPGPVRSISIMEKWITQMDKATAGTNRSGLIATRLAESGLVARGKSENYVFLPPESFLLIADYVSINEETVLLKARGKGRGFVVKRETLDTVGSNATEITVKHGDLTDVWYLMTLEAFAATIHDYSIYVP